MPAQTVIRIMMQMCLSWHLGSPARVIVGCGETDPGVGCRQRSPISPRGWNSSFSSEEYQDRSIQRELYRIFLIHFGLYDFLEKRKSLKLQHLISSQTDSRGFVPLMYGANVTSSSLSTTSGFTLLPPASIEVSTRPHRIPVYPSTAQVLVD